MGDSSILAALKDRFHYGPVRDDGVELDFRKAVGRACQKDGVYEMRGSIALTTAVCSPGDQNWMFNREAFLGGTYSPDWGWAGDAPGVRRKIRLTIAGLVGKPLFSHNATLERRASLWGGSYSRITSAFRARYGYPELPTMHPRLVEGRLDQLSEGLAKKGFGPGEAEKLVCIDNCSYEITIKYRPEKLVGFLEERAWEKSVVARKERVRAIRTARPGSQVIKRI